MTAQWVDGPVPKAIPRIRKCFGFGHLWVCLGLDGYGVGSTPYYAYNAWANSRRNLYKK